LRVLVQRVKNSKVIIEQAPVSEIGQGFLLFVGISRDDQSIDLRYLAKKVLNLRVFADAAGKMNLNIQQVNGQVLSVSQFTLCADTRKGNRPGFDNAADPAKAKAMWQEFNELLQQAGLEVKEGVFGTIMQVKLTNDGPVTIWLDSRSPAE